MYFIKSEESVLRVKLWSVSCPGIRTEDRSCPGAVSSQQSSRSWPRASGSSEPCWAGSCSWPAWAGWWWWSSCGCWSRSLPPGSSPRHGDCCYKDTVSVEIFLLQKYCCYKNNVTVEILLLQRYCYYRNTFTTKILLLPRYCYYRKTYTTKILLLTPLSLSL